MSRVRVADIDDLPAGEGTLVEADGVEVAVFNVDGEYYAVGNTCLHRGGPICKGKTMTEVAAEDRGPTERIKEWYTDVPTVSCPWHGWEYRLETGEHLGDSDLKLPTYDVSVEDDAVFVEV
jgi:nitrite reductase/ring-hydroxylating ferredoxin subunit